MKKYFFVIAIFIVLVIGIPAIPLLGSTAMIIPNPTESTPTTMYETFKILDEKSGQVSEVPVRDYVIGAVEAEMPASFHEEALKAQAVAAHTYAVRLAMKERATPTAELSGADFSNNPDKYQAFFTTEQAKQFYGTNFELYNDKISKAVDAVLSTVIVYNGEPINAAFHSISSGITESAATVWGSEVAYLTPTVSEGDISSTDYTATKSFTTEEVRAILTQKKSDLVLPVDPATWFGIAARSYSGTVTKLTVGDLTLTGMEARTSFGLRSACFEVAYAADTFTFTTKGYGHGVGLSQYGANYMANQGKSYKDILLHYYTGVELTEL